MANRRRRKRRKRARRRRRKRRGRSGRGANLEIPAPDWVVEEARQLRRSGRFALSL
jgi:hypothetical protein